MPDIQKPKYFETVTFHRIFPEVITAVRYLGTVTYQEIAQIMSLLLTGSYMGKGIDQILGEIAEDEVRLSHAQCTCC